MQQPTGGSLAHATYLAQRRFGSLDGLRAVAVLAVIWHHSTGGPGLAGVGYFGVDLFFALSGFLITTLLLREHAATGSIDLRSFYVRRCLRILPLYYLVLGVYVLGWSVTLRGTPVGDRFGRDLPAFATFTSNWFVQLAPGDAPVLFFHAWSLATEEQFYLLWPPLLALLVVRRGGSWLPAAALAVTLVVHLVAQGTAHEPSLAVVVLASISTAVCAGALLAVVLHSARGYALVGPALRWRGSLPGLVLLALVLLWSGSPPDVIRVLFGFVVAACCVREDHLLRWPLEWRPVRYLGSISYGMYLLHYLCIGAVAAATVPIVPDFVLAVALTVLVAAASFRWFEAPLLRIKDRFAAATTVAPTPCHGLSCRSPAPPCPGRAATGCDAHRGGRPAPATSA